MDPCTKSSTARKVAQAATNIISAVDAIIGGWTARLDLNQDIKVYKVGNVVRIDVKIDKEEQK